MDIKIQLPYRTVQDEPEVKVTRGSQSNMLLLGGYHHCSFNSYQLIDYQKPVSRSLPTLGLSHILMVF